MGFLIICAVIALVIQLPILCLTRERLRILRFVALVCLEALPVCGILYYLIKKPGGLFGWDFGVAFCLWATAAVLAGYLLAWAVYSAVRKHKAADIANNTNS